MHPSSPHPLKARPARITAFTAGALALVASGSLLPVASAAPDPAPLDAGGAAAYQGAVEVVEGTNADQEVLDGTVFDDKNTNSTQDTEEPGIAGVTVSNGREVTTTDSQGRYELPAYDNMTVFVTQPRGYQVPVDEDNVAQFSYQHLPEGSPELRYGVSRRPVRCRNR